MTERARHPARRSRIAALGVGVAAMAGLVSNMEVADSRAQVAVPEPSSAWILESATVAADTAGARSRQIAAPRPIVLTPRVVVHTVTAPATGGGSSGSGGATTAAPTVAPAPAPATAPAASTSGSH
jgi:hypothetical protein